MSSKLSGNGTRRSYNNTAERMIGKALSKIEGKIREDADHAVKWMRKRNTI